MDKIFNILTGTVLATVLYFLGGWDIALQTLLLFMILDYITGVCKSFYNQKLDSKIGAKGIIKKVGYLIVVAVAVEIDRLIGNTGAIRTVIIYSFVANEGLSLLENWGGMGLPLPKKIYDVLEQLKDNKGE